MNKKHLLVGIILVSLAGFFYLLVSVDLLRLYDILTSANIRDLGMFLFLSLLMMFGFTLTWREFLLAEGIDINLGTLFNFRMAGFAVSYTTPGPRVGGEIIRANMAEPHGNFSTLIVTSVMEMICIFLSSIALVVITLLLTPVLFSSVSLSLLWWTIIALLSATLTVYLFRQMQNQLHEKILNILDYFGVIPDKHKEHISDFLNEITKFFTTKKTVFMRGLTIAFTCKLLLVAQLFFLLEMVGFQATALQALLLAAAVELAYAVPGYMGIGFLEAGQTGVLAVLGLSPSVGVITAMLTRARDLLASSYGFLALNAYSDRSQSEADHV